MKKNQKYSAVAGIVFFVLAALCSISLLLVAFDFGAASPARNSIFYSLGKMFTGVYGLCSVCIPAFLIAAGIQCFMSKWRIRNGVMLLGSVVPFFTLDAVEHICRMIAASNSGSVMTVKLASTLLIGTLILAAEYLLLSILGDVLENSLAENDEYNAIPGESGEDDDITIFDGGQGDGSDESPSGEAENATEKKPLLSLGKKDAPDSSEEKLDLSHDKLFLQQKELLKDLIDGGKPKDDKAAVSEHPVPEKEGDDETVAIAVSAASAESAPAEKAEAETPQSEDEPEEPPVIEDRDFDEAEVIPESVTEDEILEEEDFAEPVLPEEPSPFDQLFDGQEAAHEDELRSDIATEETLAEDAFVADSDSDSDSAQDAEESEPSLAEPRLAEPHVQDVSLPDYDYEEPALESEPADEDAEAEDFSEPEISESEPFTVPEPELAEELAQSTESVLDERPAQSGESMPDEQPAQAEEAEPDEYETELSENDENDEDFLDEEDVPINFADFQDEDDEIADARPIALDETALDEVAPDESDRQGADDSVPEFTALPGENPADFINIEDISEQKSDSDDGAVSAPIGVEDIFSQMESDAAAQPVIKQPAAPAAADSLYQTEPILAAEPAPTDSADVPNADEPETEEPRIAEAEAEETALPAESEELSDEEEPAEIGETAADEDFEEPSFDDEYDFAPNADEAVEVDEIEENFSETDNVDEATDTDEYDASEDEDEILDQIDEIADIDFDDEVDAPDSVSAEEVALAQKAQLAQQGQQTQSTQIAQEPQRKLSEYKIPTDLLEKFENDEYWRIDDETRAAGENLKQTLNEFDIDVEVTGIRKGPVVTMFELLPAPGVKLSKIVNLQDNIALSLAAKSVRIVAPIPGKHAVGIEIPNKERAVVSFREIIEQQLPEFKKMAVPVILGKDISGQSQIIDIAKTPHLLIAGATGAGKSVCVNSIILSILYNRSPRDVKLIMVDPKVVELKLYNDIPHLLTPVVTEPKRALQVLQYCICEMERRYALLDGMGVRDIVSYNTRIRERNIATEKLPYIVVIIDEFADLMATSGKELETNVARLTAMSRAVGIHLVLATQRPSVNVITGLIKANIPSRIAFMVASRTDSNIIIDATGAEKLLGKGDMLYTSAVNPIPTRIQGTLVGDNEVERVVDYVKSYGGPDYIDDEIFVDDEEEEEDKTGLFSDGEDPLYDQALQIVIQAGKASASYIQRRLKIGYNRAARLVEEMEERGIVGPANGAKPREVIHVP